MPTSLTCGSSALLARGPARPGRPRRRHARCSGIRCSLGFRSRSKTQFGVHQDLTYDGYDWRRAKGIAAAAAVHAQVSRNSLLWSKIEATRGTYDWSIPDSVVDGLRAKRDRTPLRRRRFAVLGKRNRARVVGQSVLRADRHQSVLDLGQRLHRLHQESSRRYKGRVSKWEIWNEENEHFTLEAAAEHLAIREVLHQDPQRDSLRRWQSSGFSRGDDRLLLRSRYPW